MRRGLVLSVLGVTAMGCASSRPVVRTHQPMRQVAQAPEPLRWARAVRLIASSGWVPQVLDRRQGLAMALRTAADDGTLRERLRIDVRRGETAVEVRSEVFDGLRWRPARLPCGDCHRALERLILSGLEGEAGVGRLREPGP